MSVHISLLFLCTGNSCRSQMAEGWCRYLRSDSIMAYSAGIVAKGLDPRAVAVMAEVGIDISSQASKTTDALDGVEFDFVVTVCGHANETCPYFPARTQLIHAGFDDPPLLVLAAASEDEALGHYRRVRDDIREFVEMLPEALCEGADLA